MSKEKNRIKFEQEVKNILSSVLKISKKEINSNSSTITIDEWDSLKHVQVVLNLERFFKIQFNVNEYHKLTSFNNIINLLKKKYKL